MFKQIKKFKSVNKLTILLLLLISFSNVFSQSSTFTYPENNAVNVELIPTIILKTPYRILESSITDYYFCNDSSEYDFGEPQFKTIWTDDFFYPDLEIEVPYAIYHERNSTNEENDISTYNQWPSKTEWRLIPQYDFPYNLNQKIYECSQLFNVDAVHYLIGVFDDDWVSPSNWSSDVNSCLIKILQDGGLTRNTLNQFSSQYDVLNFFSNSLDVLASYYGYIAGEAWASGNLELIGPAFLSSFF